MLHACNDNNVTFVCPDLFVNLFIMPGLENSGQATEKKKVVKMNWKIRLVYYSTV